MLADKKNVALIRAVKLRLEVPLEGPYVHLLRRPLPEVEALGSGACIVVVRAGRVRRPAPLLPAVVSCYYSRAVRGGLKPEDFRDPEWARLLLQAAEPSAAPPLRYLAVPVGHVRLPQETWVSRLAARLSPWTEAAVERWRRHLKRSAWLSALRVYEFEPISLDTAPCRGVAEVPPLHLSDLRPVLDEAAFEKKLGEVLEAVETTGKGELPKAAGRAARALQAPTRQPAYSLDDFAADTGFDPQVLEEWEQRLRRKKQLIFYGPPGSGKTYAAERLARRLTAQSAGFWELVQFHPAYAYEDFVQGIRPRSRQGRLSYELAEGRFLEFCRRARERGRGSPCVLVIDEINRAHLAQVLGELMYLLEYRQRAIPLAAGGAPFQIPAQVYLIGTMNTADRSIALVDQALRRRFAFVRLQPEYGVLRRYLEKWGLPAAGLLATLREINRQIGDPNYEVGISFFMQDGARLRAALPRIWVGEIEPYLEEVFYDRPEKMESCRWERLAAGRLKEWS